MRKFFFAIIAAGMLVLVAIVSPAFQEKLTHDGYILDHEKDVAVNQPGPHDGGGNTTAYNFFANATNCKLVFRKRTLHPGSAIGYHPQSENEIYYIVSGKGDMKMNGKTFEVNAGDAILTLPGSSHGLTQKGKDDLVMIINYEKK